MEKLNEVKMIFNTLLLKEQIYHVSFANILHLIGGT